MNKTQIATLTLVVISLFLNGYNISNNNKDINELHAKINYTLSENNNIEVRINDLEEKQEDNVTIEEGKALVDYIVKFEDNFYKAVEVYDENVEIYNSRIKENSRLIDEIIDYLK